MLCQNYPEVEQQRQVPSFHQRFCDENEGTISLCFRVFLPLEVRPGVFFVFFLDVEGAWKTKIYVARLQHRG